MTLAARLLQNGRGNFVDHNKYMDNWYWCFAMGKGNRLSNGGFESWAGGTSFVNPANGAALCDAWTLEKGGTSACTADVTRESTTIDTGTYSLKLDISAAGSSDSYINFRQAVTNFSRLGGQTVTFGIRVKVATGTKVRPHMQDGVSSVYGNYHTGDGTWQLLTVTMTCAAAAAMSFFVMHLVVTTDFSGDPVYVDSAFLYITDAAMSADAVAALVYFTPDELAAFAANYIDLTGQAAAPTAVAGRVYFNSVDGQFYGCKDGATWSILG